MTAPTTTGGLCPCGHPPIDHHGIDPDDGCLGAISHKKPPCPCRLTYGEAEASATNNAMYDWPHEREATHVDV